MATHTASWATKLSSKKSPHKERKNQMANENGMSAVAISEKALTLVKQEQERRFTEEGVKMTFGAIVSEAVFKTFGAAARA